MVLISEILSKYKNVSDIFNLKGCTVWPGLTDSHLHLEHLSNSLANVNCETKTLAECLNRIAKKAQETSGTSFILGHGWNHNIWDNASYGTAALLDEITGEHPTYLTAKSLHAAWVNSKALKIAGIDRTTPNPPGGIIERDREGKPTGILLEFAMALVENIIPSITSKQLANDFKKLLPYFWKVGITSVHDFLSTSGIPGITDSA